VVGEAEPHGAAEHDTVQVTPLFVGSPATVAVMCAVPPACTLLVSCATETVTLSGACMPPPPPPLQPAMMIVQPTTRSVRAEDFLVFMAASAGSIFRAAGITGCDRNKKRVRLRKMQGPLYPLFLFNSNDSMSANGNVTMNKLSTGRATKDAIWEGR
jgi:hypothetical protein